MTNPVVAQEPGEAEVRYIACNEPLTSTAEPDIINSIRLVTPADAAAFTRRIHPEHSYTDDDAVTEYMIVNWAWWWEPSVALRPVSGPDTRAALVEAREALAEPQSDDGGFLRASPSWRFIRDRVVASIDRALSSPAIDAAPAAEEAEPNPERRGDAGEAQTPSSTRQWDSSRPAAEISGDSNPRSGPTAMPIRATKATPAMVKAARKAVDDSYYGENLDDDEMECALNAALSLAGAGDGWQLVPKKLTDEMIKAARSVDDGPLRTYQEHWDIMLAAAPHPSQEQKP